MTETDWSTLENYPKFVTKLGSSDSTSDFKAKVGTVGLGLAGEAGEVLQIVQDRAQKGAEWLPVDNDRLIDELSDLCWYVAFGVSNVLPNRDFRDFVPAVMFEAPWKQEPDRAKFLRKNYTRLVGHCCRIADMSKKIVYHGRPFEETVQVIYASRLHQVMEEIGILAKKVCQCTVETIIAHNVVKLSKRYKDLTFSTEAFMVKENSKTED